MGDAFFKNLNIIEININLILVSMGENVMSESDDFCEVIKEKIAEFNIIKQDKLKDYSKEKGEISRYFRSDFLTGGILASSLFLILKN